MRLPLAQGRKQEALRRWKDVVRRLPITDYLTELGELQLSLGRSEQAAKQFRVVSETNEAEWDRRHSIHVADALGTPAGHFWLHRGTVEAALGLDEAARAHLVRGLRVDPGLSPWKLEQGRSVLRQLPG